IDTFVLLSGDSDFTPLVHRLKELDKRVIGIGTRRSTSRLLAESVDEFIFYESLKRKDSPSRDGRDGRPERKADKREERDGIEEDVDTASRTLTREEAFTLVSETVQGILRDDPGAVLAGLVKQSMQRKEPTFDETEYGYSGFARFLEAARDKGLIALARDPRAGGYRVDLPNGSGAAPAEPGRDTGRKADAEPEGEDDSDAMLDGHAGVLQGLLAGIGPHPLTHFIRHTVVHEFVDHVTERQRRKKRNTLMYVYGDIARRCRKTDPYVPPRYVKHVINGIKAAGELQHTSGEPVRSQSAHFMIEKDSEELLDALRRHYVGQLLGLGADLTDSAAVSLLLWGDEDHAQQAEEMVAWIQHERAQSETDAGEETVVEEGAPTSEDPPEAPAADADEAPESGSVEADAEEEAETTALEPEEAPAEPEETPDAAEE
ncbi:MAG: NYN domain-containing protein, partial [Myxococcota bacterium]|nr:NYN domain-containing protein [Myxococcota bacterium]